ncbi:MAG: TetR/AcrR family transcriptional regulator [Humidesulfovibrio sp.]|jgi:AcrR family transcriptional regulator|nr:TetR/AcrR family transcriptional regulator [Humidesulfovibrio sp.]
MARPKNEQLHEDRRLQILKAAAEVFRTKGFHASRTEEICSTAKMSAGTLFRYFRDKEEIIATIAEMEFEMYYEKSKMLFTRDGFEYLASIDGEGMRQLWGPVGLGLGLDSWLELYRSEKYAAQYKAKDATLRLQLADALRCGQSEGWVRQMLNPDHAAQIIIALCSGMLVEQQLDPGMDFEHMAGGLRGFVSSYIMEEVSR